jgi:hypothetical protein
MDKHIHKAQSVVDMSIYKPETGYAAVAQVEAYWNALRGENLLPKRSEIDPRGIERSLENAFILERIAPGIARLRIAGNHLNDLMGMEVRGMPLTALFTPAARRTIADLLEDVFQTPATAKLQLTSDGSSGRPALDARMILMPLKSDLGDVSRILGCLVAKGDMGLAPRRFDIAELDKTRLGTQAHVGPRKAPRPVQTFTASEQSETQGFAEPKATFTAQSADQRSRAAKRPPYLRLVKSDE